MCPIPPRQYRDTQNARKTPDFEELAKKMPLLTS
jgi:hypothetical protein